MTTFDLVHLNVAEHVCSRRGMYTENGTLSEVLAFFDGYSLAMREGAAADSDRSPDLLLAWLVDECKIDNLYDPRNRTEKIIARFGSEDTAFDQMLQHASTLSRP